MNIKANIKTRLSNSHFVTTGSTITYVEDGKPIDYIWIDTLSEISGLSTRQLQRLRTRVETEIPNHEHRYYFVYKDRKLIMTQQLVLKYCSKSVKQRFIDNYQLAVIKSHAAEGKGSDFKHGLENMLMRYRWTHSITINYPDDECLTMEQVASKMQVLYQTLAQHRQAFKMAVLTERSVGRQNYHNHILLSFDEANMVSVAQINECARRISDNTHTNQVYSQNDLIKYVIKQGNFIGDGFDFFHFKP